MSSALHSLLSPAPGNDIFIPQKSNITLRNRRRVYAPKSPCPSSARTRDSFLERLHSLCGKAPQASAWLPITTDNIIILMYEKRGGKRRVRKKHFFSRGYCQVPFFAPKIGDSGSFRPPGLTGCRNYHHTFALQGRSLAPAAQG